MLLFVAIIYACPHASAEQAPGNKIACDNAALLCTNTVGAMAQGRDGWFFRINGDLREDFELSHEMQSYLKRFAYHLKKAGTELVIVSIPTRGMIAQNFDTDHKAFRRYQRTHAMRDYHDMLSAYRNLGIITADVIAQWRKEGSPSSFFFKRDHHWTPQGARIAAKAIRSALEKHTTYQNIPPIPFKTRKNSTAQIKHKMAEAIEQRCSSNVPPEYFETFETSQIASSTGEEALFGDTINTPSALVGSSFSAQSDFNFDGFISEYTGMNIVNHAISGGLLYNSIVSYLSSDQYAHTPPPYLIWEAPATYDVNRNASQAYRQLIPATYPSCVNQQVMSQQSSISSEKNWEPLLQLSADHKIKGAGYYLVIKTENPLLNHFTLSFDYDDQDGEWFLINRSMFHHSSGNIYIELHAEIMSNLESISLKNHSGIASAVTSTLCSAPQETTI